MNGVLAALPVSSSLAARVRAAIAAGVPAAVVIGVAIGAGAWAAGLLLQRTAGLATPAYDLAFFQQIVWHLGVDGRWESSFHQGSFLGLHFSPILLVPAAIERLLGPDARILNVIHAASVAALGPATFLLAGAVLRPSRFGRLVAAGLAVAVPLSAAMQEVIRADFHPEMAGVVLALLAGWAGLTGRRRTMWVLVAAALLTREDVAYAVLVVGLLVAARGRGSVRRHGLGVAGVAIAWAAIVFLVAMPWLRDGAFVDTHRYYRWLGSGPAVLQTPFTRTDAILEAINRPASWFFVGGMVLSFAALPVLRPRWLLLAVPPLAAVLLSAHPPQATLQLQYPLILVAPLTVAGLLGARRGLALTMRARRRFARGRTIVRPAVARRALPAVLAVGLAIPAVAVAFAQGALPPFDHAQDTLFSRAPAIDRVRAVAAQVPAGVTLAVDGGLAAPLAQRTSLHVLTRTMPSARTYVLIDRAAWFPNGAAKEKRDRFVAAAQAAPRPIVADDGRFLLLGPEPGTGTH